MTWQTAMRWALYWAQQTGNRRRVYAYRISSGWAYAVTTDANRERREP